MYLIALHTGVLHAQSFRFICFVSHPTPLMSTETRSPPSTPPPQPKRNPNAQLPPKAPIRPSSIARLKPLAAKPACARKLVFNEPKQEAE